MQRKRLEGVHAHIKTVYLMDDFYILIYVFPVILNFLNERIIFLKLFLKVY